MAIHAKPKSNEADLSPRNILDTVHDEICKWMSTEGTPKKIRARVVEYLNSRYDNILMTILGLESRGFDRLEIRSGSKLANVVETYAEGAVDVWAADNLKTIKYKPDESFSALFDKYAQQYKEALRHRMQEIVKQRAELDINRALDAMSGNIDVIKKLAREMSLVAPEPQATISLDFETKSILAEATITAIVIVKPDGKLVEAADDPANTDVRFVVRLVDKVIGATATIITDGDKWQPLKWASTAAESQIVVDYFSTYSQLKIFTLMGDVDKQVIKKAIDEYLEAK